jgi:hypothetical protein
MVLGWEAATGGTLFGLKSGGRVWAGGSVRVDRVH